MARSYYDDHFDPGADREELRERHQKKREISRPKVYVRYDEGAELYSMCKNTFIKLIAIEGLPFSGIVFGFGTLILPGKRSFFYSLSR